MMAASLEDLLQESIRALTQEQQREVLAFVEELKQRTTPHKPIWEEFQELSHQVAEEEWRKLPADGAEQHDHYLYGAPKKEQP